MIAPINFTLPGERFAALMAVCEDDAEVRHAVLETARDLARGRPASRRAWMERMIASGVSPVWFLSENEVARICRSAGVVP